MPATGAASAVELDDDADLEGTHADWTRWRRRQRLAEVHWVDALYQAYLAALLVGIAIVTPSPRAQPIAIATKVWLCRALTPVRRAISP